MVWVGCPIQRDREAQSVPAERSSRSSSASDESRSVPGQRWASFYAASWPSWISATRSSSTSSRVKMPSRSPKLFDHGNQSIPVRPQDIQQPVHWLVGWHEQRVVSWLVEGPAQISPRHFAEDVLQRDDAIYPIFLGYPAGMSAGGGVERAARGRFFGLAPMILSMM